MRIRSTLSHHLALASLVFAISVVLLIPAHGQLRVEWITQYGSSADDYGRAITVDTLGQSWVNGTTTGDLGGANAGARDIFLSRISASGSVDFSRQRGSPGYEDGEGIALVGGGTVFIAGGTDLGTLDGVPGLGSSDAALMRYDTSGTWQGTTRFGSTQSDYIVELAGNATNLFIAGYTDGSFGGQTNAGYGDIFLSKRDSIGAVIWTRFVGTNDYEYGGGLALDSVGNAYLAGTTHGSFSGYNNNPARFNPFVVRFDSAGNQTLLKQFVMSPGTGANAYDIGVDLSGNIYVTGSASGSFGGQINAGFRDAFVMKLDSAGNMLWTRLFGGSANNEDGVGLALDGMGHIWISELSTPVFGSRKDADAFVVEYDTDGNLLGTISFATSSDEAISDLAIGADGAVYVTGYTRTLDTLGDPIEGSADIFVAKIVSVPEPCTPLLLAGSGLMILLRRLRHCAEKKEIGR